jgi:tetratricopeptide (TPR) repeat protein
MKKILYKQLLFDQEYTKWWRHKQSLEFNRTWKNKEASVILLRRLDFQPNDIEALFLIVITLQNIEEYKKALYYVNRAIKIFKKTKSNYLPWFYIKKGHIFYHMEKYSLALHYYKKASKDIYWCKEIALERIERCK